MEKHYTLEDDFGRTLSFTINFQSDELENLILGSCYWNQTEVSEIISLFASDDDLYITLVYKGLGSLLPNQITFCFNESHGNRTDKTREAYQALICWIDTCHLNESDDVYRVYTDLIPEPSTPIPLLTTSHELYIAPSSGVTIQIPYEWTHYIGDFIIPLASNEKEFPGLVVTSEVLTDKTQFVHVHNILPHATIRIPIGTPLAQLVNMEGLS